MAIEMMPRRRNGIFNPDMGAFGNDIQVMPQQMQQPQMDGTQAAINQYASMPKAEKKRWLEGGKFTTKDAIGLALGALGDALSGRNTTAQMIYGAKDQQRQAQMAAEQQRAQLQDWLWKKQWEQANPGPSPIERDAAAWMSMTPEQKAAYTAQREAAAGPITATLPNNMFYTGPRSGMIDALRAMSGGKQTLPTAPVGKLTAITPTTRNTPAPQVGGNGFPSVLTPDQYQATVNEMGKAQTDAWMQRNGIRIGG